MVEKTSSPSPPAPAKYQITCGTNGDQWDSIYGSTLFRIGSFLLGGCGATINAADNRRVFFFSSLSSAPLATTFTLGGRFYKRNMLDTSIGTIRLTRVEGATAFYQEDQETAQHQSNGGRLGLRVVLDDTSQFMDVLATTPYGRFRVLAPHMLSELEGDLTSRLTATVSARSEHYSDFGSTSNGRLALRYAFTPALAWRFSAGTGYRAPSLGQTAYSRTIPNITNGVLATNRLARVDSTEARALGERHCRPEESRNFSTGVVWTPSESLSATLDIYRIDIDDRFVLSETLNGALVRQVLSDAGYPTYSGLQYFTNAVDTRTRGVDATLRKSISASMPDNAST
ncbi:MAG: TonB-dependent receptor [Mesorhizobium sp.]